MVLIVGVATVAASESDAVDIENVGNGFMNAISVDSADAHDSDMGRVVSEQNHIDMISEDANENLTVDAIHYDDIALQNIN